MSEQWNPTSAAAAARASQGGADAVPRTFVPWAQSLRAHAAEPADEHLPASLDPTQIEAQAFARGYAEGREEAEAALADERFALQRLAQGLATLEPEPHHELAQLLAETVERLVRQIVGEVSLDTAILSERVERAAMLIAEESSPSRMRLNPEDHARMDGCDLVVELVADPGLAPGTVLVETGEGWIEDGPEVGLEKLRIALDRMGVAR